MCPDILVVNFFFDGLLPISAKAMSIHRLTGSRELMVLQMILASKLSELEQFENFAANNHFRKQKRVKMTPKSI